MIRSRLLFLFVTLALLATAGLPAYTLGANTQAMPDWLEPRGISVLELVGQVPESYLQGTILSYGDGDGIAVYQSGVRDGNAVTVTATLYPRVTIPPWSNGAPLSSFGCLGQTPHFDHPGTMVPKSILRVYDASGADVTAQIYSMYLAHMDTRLPSGGPFQPLRYPQDHYSPVAGDLPLPLTQEGLIIPANSGCRVNILGHDYRVLTGVFTMEFEPTVRASVVGTQEATFQSYIGVGSVGIFTDLMNQLRSTYGDRHERIPLSVPAGADFFLLKFPPMPGDPYTDKEAPFRNADRPSAGTYRLSKNVSELSTDLVFSAAFPLHLAWRDADQSGSSEFLPVMWEPTDLAPPEYVIPAGVPYDPCFTTGNCSSSVLRQIYSAQMNLQIIYLQVNRMSADKQWVPLKMAGPSWYPAAAAPTPADDALNQPMPLMATLVGSSTHQIFLPYIIKDIANPAPSGCLCGYFDTTGRMLDVAQ